MEAHITARTRASCTMNIITFMRQTLQIHYFTIPKLTFYISGLDPTRSLTWNFQKPGKHYQVTPHSNTILRYDTSQQ